ncbi:hypothetical protein DFH07DRAFT_771108 [Mycena maculata]|uniref:Uncharacterized protein n=1 Tax=Mycena maculata TaxID=230809 RepID=A0AAD7JD07_9AGAR|nr:hypothetical protein DFH07DRAFT_771108 [Mycena maculata]
MMVMPNKAIFLIVVDGEGDVADIVAHSGEEGGRLHMFYRKIPGEVTVQLQNGLTCGCRVFYRTPPGCAKGALVKCLQHLFRYGGVDVPVERLSLKQRPAEGSLTEGAESRAYEGSRGEIQDHCTTDVVETSRPRETWPSAHGLCWSESYHGELGKGCSGSGGLSRTTPLPPGDDVFGFELRSELECLELHRQLPAPAVDSEPVSTLSNKIE